MNFKQFLLTLDQEECIVWIRELSRTTQGEARFALCGVLEIHDDFILVHSDDDGIASAVRICDILVIEPCGNTEDEEEEEDVFDKFERYYKEYKEDSE